MAADVSSLVRVLNRYKDDRTAGSETVGGKQTSLITQDLLGGGGGGGGGGEAVKNEYQELDLDLQVPSGWEKRLDLKSGKVYLQRCNSSSSPSSSDHKHQTNQTVPKLQDLNFPPWPSKPLLNLFDERNLDLKLVPLSSSSSPPPQSSNNYQSVCTLDKVKSALERVNREPNYKKRSTTTATLWNASLSPSYSSSSSSIKDTKEMEEIEERVLSSSPVAAGCPGCLCYVLIMKNNPKCPRCNSMVPMPAMKKPKIDLNMSI
ncbi:hypothetical protein ACOSP7_027743 [Xanthoceras sorbifolium]